MNKYNNNDLVGDLAVIFPEFASWWATENEGDEFRSSSLHGAYMDFMAFLADAQPTPEQWQLLADHLSASVAAGGNRENAADTCVLEHLHQVKLNGILRPLLSEEARAYVRV